MDLLSVVVRGLNVNEKGMSLNPEIVVERKRLSAMDIDMFLYIQ
jgi:hypothetical protein